MYRRMKRQPSPPDMKCAHKTVYCFEGMLLQQCKQELKITEVGPSVAEVSVTQDSAGEMRQHVWHAMWYKWLKPQVADAVCIILTM